MNQLQPWRPQRALSVSPPRVIVSGAPRHAPAWMDDDGLTIAESTPPNEQTHKRQPRRTSTEIISLAFGAMAIGAFACSFALYVVQ